ncbi:MAG: MBL fold metallo-hydrolase [Methylocella sp.]
MKVTIVGCGDAFGSGGRAHSCFRIDADSGVALVDFGAGSIVSWKKLGFQFDVVDAVVISHLHGDHFGGLPFLLFDCQFVRHRTRPLILIGPPGFKKRLDAALELFFPGASKTPWSFPWSAEEIVPGRQNQCAGFTLQTYDAFHPSGALSTGVRLTGGGGVFAYSGDTAFTPTLFDLSAGADLFICECSSGDSPTPYHIDWPTLRANLQGFSAKRMILTHMGDSALARRAEMEQAGLTVAYDGQVFEL